MATEKVSKRKVISSFVAIVMAAIIVLGGTFAWQSINQEALNEVFSTVNPGGRLHDDFVEITYGSDQIADYETMTFNKDVYVENFTSLASNGVQIFARVRLDEYMELGDNAGALDTEGKKAANNSAVSIVSDAKLDDKTTWTTHIPGNLDDPFHKYWDWTIGGQTKYLPTFNKDNTSLEADINGTFRENFKDYVDYAGISENHDDVNEAESDATYYDKAEEMTYTIKENHTVKETLEGYVITMQEWIDQGKPVGDFWVWDTDGWAYWANPIDPDTATGLLLDSVYRTPEIINEDWYYGINVVAQFITKDDIGYDNNTGFYDLSAGSVPSENALLLLDTIGVDVTFEAENKDELKAALANGGNVVLTANVTVDEAVAVSESVALDLNNQILTTSYTNNYAFNVKGDLTVSGEGEVNVTGYGLATGYESDGHITINGGNFTAEDCNYLLGCFGGNITINDGTFNGKYCVVNNFCEYYEIEGTVTINGGTFAAEYPVLGGKVVINGGSFNGSFDAENSDITIKGGSFTADPTQFLADGYRAEKNADNIWIVSQE